MLEVNTVRLIIDLLVNLAIISIEKGMNLRGKELGRKIVNE
jgi:hypothetical protein